MCNRLNFHYSSSGASKSISITYDNSTSDFIGIPLPCAEQARVGRLLVSKHAACLVHPGLRAWVFGWRTDRGREGALNTRTRTIHTPMARGTSEVSEGEATPVWVDTHTLIYEQELRERIEELYN